MPPPSPLDPDLHALHTSLTSLRDLLTSFQTSLQSPPSPNEAPHHHPLPAQPANPPPPPNPLALLSSASHLLKAQTTKLSLLLLNPPLSAREATHIITTLSNNVLPTLMTSGAESLHPARYTRVVQEHVKATLGILWREVPRLLDCVPVVDDDDDDDDGEGSSKKEAVGGKKEDAAALASTGVLWEQCDELVLVGEIGVRGVVDGRVKGYGELLDDAVGEIGGWDPEEEEEGEGDSDSDEEGGEDGNSTHEEEEEEEEKKKAVIATPTTSDEEEEEAIGEGLRSFELSPQVALKAKVLKFLRLLRLFYPAMRKRRVATWPNVTRNSAEDDMPAAQQVERLDQLVGFAQYFSEETDELAGALYADERGEAVGKLRTLEGEAKKCALLMERDWDGQEDEFCNWLRKWSGLVREATI